MKVDLNEWDIIIVNSSGGKDSQTALRQVALMARAQGYSATKIHVVHADLGREEWPGVKELAEQQANHFGLSFHSVKRQRANGENDSILDYTLRRNKWPSSTTRWCTSDFKRGPCQRVITKLAKTIEGKSKVLNVFGFRSQESPARAKKDTLTYNKKASSNKREVWDWLPIHDWDEAQVWNDIKESNVPYHYAYDLGMKRLSCCFCIFAPKSALMIAGKANPKLLDDYVAVEHFTGHSFRMDQSLRDIKQSIKENHHIEPDASEWNM